MGEERTFENQMSVRRNCTASTTFAIAVGGRDFEFTFLANAHVAKAFIPSFDHLAYSHCRCIAK